jgi:cysteine desulfurase
MLDVFGIEVSTGSACSARDLKPSHVLLAIGQPDELAHGSIRFSLGRDTTKKQLDYVLKVFPPIVERLTAMSALTISTQKFQPSLRHPELREGSRSVPNGKNDI